MNESSWLSISMMIFLILIVVMISLNYMNPSSYSSSKNISVPSYQFRYFI